MNYHHNGFNKADDNSGKPIVSDDDGKTWKLIDPELVPDPKVKSVVVSWIKVTD